MDLSWRRTWKGRKKKKDKVRSLLFSPLDFLGRARAWDFRRGKTALRNSFFNRFASEFESAILTGSPRGEELLKRHVNGSRSADLSFF